VVKIEPPHQGGPNEPSKRFYYTQFHLCIVKRFCYRRDAVLQRVRGSPYVTVYSMILQEYVFVTKILNLAHSVAPAGNGSRQGSGGGRPRVRASGSHNRYDTQNQGVTTNSK